MSDRRAADLAARCSLQLAFWFPLAVCTWLALTPSPPEVVGRFSDVVLHAFAFTYLTFALGLAWPALRLRWLAGLPLGYGVGIELVQGLGSARVPSVQDVLVDAGGILLGLLLLRVLGDWSRRTVRGVWGFLLPG
jgi:VanZ family protein